MPSSRLAFPSMLSRWFLVPLLLLSPPAQGALPFTESAYYSKGARPQRVSGDARDPGVVDRLAAHSFHKELILFDFTPSGHWIDWAENLSRQLHHVGFDHYSAIARDERGCNELWNRTPAASCVWSSFPDTREHAGWAQARNSNDGLTLIRFSVLARIVAVGVNVLLIDLDCIFLRDPYPALKAPPLSKAQFVFMREGWLNSGLVYFQNARRGGAALWLVQQYIGVALFNVAAAYNETPSKRPAMWNDQ